MVMPSTKVVDDDSKRIDNSLKQYFQYGNSKVSYTLVRSKRRKTSEIIVANSGDIILRVPFQTSPTEIEKILNDKIKWAIIKQKEFQSETKDIIKPTFENNSTLPYLGKSYEFHVAYRDYNNYSDESNEEDQNDGIDLIDNKFVATLAEFTNPNRNTHLQMIPQKERLMQLYQDWLYKEANRIFAEKVNHYTRVVNVKPQGIVIKDLKNRWGSLTKKHFLHLNYNLIKAPNDIIDYIVIHELAHIRIKGHSYRFWDYLRSFVPDYEKKINWLERNTIALMD
jgi:predicted metal-dependent hydrolase